jgi:transcriptional repressor NrdR
MRCPFCSHADNKVIDSRLGREGGEIRRRRECLECGRRFTTRERVDEVLPRIVKRDERREDYDRAKLAASIQKACAKRPVGAEALERLGDRVERRLQESGASEISSHLVGEWVMEELTLLDAMAAARFASVFLQCGNRLHAIFATFSLRGDASRRKRLAAEGCPRAPRRTYRCAFGPLQSEGRESDAHSVPSRRGIMKNPG